MNRPALSELPKELIIEILLKVNEGYRLSNLTSKQLEKLQEKVSQELSRRIFDQLRDRWFQDDAFTDLYLTISQIRQIEKTNDSWHFTLNTPETVEVYLYPYTENIFFISSKYPEMKRYKLSDPIDYTFEDFPILQLIQTSYSLGYL